jgi:hypothetical protein
MMLRRLGTLVIAAILAACSARGTGLVPEQPGQGFGLSDAAHAPNLSGAAATSYAYVVTFYPLWFTFNQQKHASTNRPAGPRRMSPAYHDVVAPNDDTYYVSSFLELASQPVMVTIPKSKDLWSLLSTNGYGDVNDTGISASGLYAFTGPGWSGSLPSGATQIKISTDFSQLIVRADKYAPHGDGHVQAKEFRRAIRIATLSDYQSDPNAGPPLLVPVIAAGIPFKTIADTAIATEPMKFLKELQAAVHSSNTPPMSAKEKALSNAFDAAIDASSPDTSALSLGAQKAHDAIVSCYLSATGKTDWVFFSTIGTTWSALQRSAITEYLQYGNNLTAAAYYQAFEDGTGKAIDGSTHNYVITFPKNNIPQAKRFWSITAYTPDAITLIPNSIKKYVVGSYTPGLKTNKDGSISVFVSVQQPRGVPQANWLPARKGPFNVMLRVYGPEGNTANGAYLPPAVKAIR